MPVNSSNLNHSVVFLFSVDWVTDDLLTKIGEHPLLSQAFQDPRLAQVLSQFQSNPQAVMAATRDNPEVSQTGLSELELQLPISQIKVSSSPEFFSG